MYENGRGVPQDYAEAVKCYRHAAEQGNSGAQFNLGLMYDSGRGVAQDHAEAVKWFRLAAEQGHASAQNNLGFMYAHGRGVPQDYAEAVKWFSTQSPEVAADACGVECLLAVQGHRRPDGLRIRSRRVRKGAGALQGYSMHRIYQAISSNRPEKEFGHGEP